ncbi:MAG: hypothetical protein HC906_07350 [Bacteroidales bacterium]|nr:hypothetical protein [Bacteroidales bacterium]
MRGKFRKSFEEPQPFLPGKVEQITINLPDVNHTFKKGHRLMLQVQSSWFPLFDLNPGKMMNIFEAGPNDFKKATNRVYHSLNHPSVVILNVLD